MQANELQEALVRHTLEHSGHEEQRGYLGMSRIGSCPRWLFHQVRDGSPASPASQLRFRQGYQVEQDVLARLGLVVELLGARVIISDEVAMLSACDGKFLGHPDGEIVMLDDSERILIEIKSILQESLDHITEKARIPGRHWWQVQCYLHYGGWERAFVIYEARDTGRLYVHEVRRDERMGERCEEKARQILAALARDEAPECQCGRCQ